MSQSGNHKASGIATRYHVDLPKLPDSWTYEHFENILDVQGGSQPPKSTFAFEPTPGYVQLLQIRDFGERGVPTYVREDLVTKHCQENDVLIARYGASLGRIVTGQAGAYNVALAKVIFNPHLYLGRCLYYLLQTPFFQTPLHMISRSAQNGFNKGDLSDIVLPVIPFGEQSRIVAKIEELFSDLDAGVAALERAQANLKRYRAAVLKAAVEGRLTERWRAENLPRPLGEGRGEGYEPAAKLLERILIERRQKWESAQLAKFAASNKQPPKNWKSKYLEPTPPDSSQLPELPDGWCWAVADQLCSQITDGEHIQPPYTDAGFPMLTATHVRNGRVEFNDVGYIAEVDFCRCLQRCAPTLGDVLIVSVGATTGRAGVVQECEPFALVRSVLLLKPLIPGEFLLNWIHSPWCQTWITRASGATAQAHLYISDTKRMPIPLPPEDEIQKLMYEVDRRITVVAAMELQCSQGLIRAARLRQSILKQAFAGQLVPQDPTDEPATALLERLRSTKAVVSNRQQPSNRERKRKTSRVRR